MTKRKRIATFLAIFAGAGLWASGAAHAQVNKCIDATGKTVYSQSPCPATSKSASVRQSVPSVPSQPAAAAKAGAPKSAAELELEFRKRQTEQAEAGKKASEKSAEAQQREENCRTSKGTLAGLEADGRQSKLNEKGERAYLNEAEVAAERARARAAVDQWCKSA